MKENKYLLQFKTFEQHEFKRKIIKSTFKGTEKK